MWKDPTCPSKPNPRSPLGHSLPMPLQPESAIPSPCPIYSNELLMDFLPDQLLLEWRLRHVSASSLEQCHHLYDDCPFKRRTRLDYCTRISRLTKDFWNLVICSVPTILQLHYQLLVTLYCPCKWQHWRIRPNKAEDLLSTDHPGSAHTSVHLTP